MEEIDIREIVNHYLREICHYSQMQVFADSHYQKNYFQRQIEETVDEMIRMLLQCNHLYESIDQQMIYAEEQTNQNILEYIFEESERVAGELRTFNLEELATYNGSGGRPAYVAVNGNVYDVSKLIGWAGGTHFGQYAGQDLSKVFMECHHGMEEILKNTPIVGKMRD